jgi:hypothetical protein
MWSYSVGAESNMTNDIYGEMSPIQRPSGARENEKRGLRVPGVIPLVNIPCPFGAYPRTPEGCGRLAGGTTTGERFG